MSVLAGMTYAGALPAGAVVASHRGHHPVAQVRVRVVRLRVVRPAHRSLRVVRVHPRVVRPHGRVVRARVVPWRGGAATRAERPGQGAGQGSGVRLAAFPSGGSGITEYQIPTANSTPQGLTVTAGGAAWFTENNGQKIGQVTSGGSFTEYPITGAGLYPTPQGISVGPDGNLWFGEEGVSAGPGYIGQITPSGTITQFALPDYHASYDTTPGPDGNEWFTELNDTIGSVTLAGGVTEYELDQGSGDLPEGITAGPDGALWFTEVKSGRIGRITTGGAVTEYQMPSGSSLTDGITTGPDGQIWFIYGTSIGAMNPANGSYTLYQLPTGYSPAQITQDGAGNLVFTVGQATDAIGQISTSGLASFTTIPSGNRPYGIGVAHDGTIWFDEPSANEVGVLPPGPAQFPPGVPVAQTYGCLCGTSYSAQAQVLRGDPVNTATGAFTQRATDARMPGPGVAFAFTRTYTSLDTTTGPLGQGWADPYAARLTFDSSGNPTFHAADGQQLHYTKNADGSYTGDPGVFATLTAVSGGYQLVARDGTTHDFDSTGRMTSLTNRVGTGLTFSYSGGNLASVTDAGGRTVTFGYNSSGLLTSLTLPDGRATSYGYANGLLTSVTDPAGGVTSYGYDSAGRLTTITDPDTNVVISNTYDSSTGRITSQVNGDGKTTTFSWNATTQTATTMRPGGGTWTDVYNDNVLLSVTDPLGNTTYYAYDGNLDQARVTTPAGQWAMTYDSAGNMISRTAPAPLYYKQTWTYNNLHEVLSYTDGRGNTTTNTYDSNGLLTSTIDAAGDGYSFSYFADGQLKTVTNPLSNTTSYAYDSSLDLASVTAPGGLVTSFGYDTTGRRTSVTNPLGKTTSYAYDKDDHLTSVTDPLNHVTSFGYDADGHRISVTDARGYTTTYAYDPAGHLTSATDPLGHATSYTYTPDGKISTVTDAESHVTTYHYDAADKVTSVTRPDGTTLAYGYDASGNLTSYTDGAGNLTTYAYDPLGRVIATINPLGYENAYAYDPNGNLVTLTNPKGPITYGYDKANRLTSIGYSDGITPGVTYTYDKDSHRLTMADGTGTTSYAYDTDGRLTSVTNGAGQTVSYGYDKASDVTTIAYPNGKAVTRGYNAAQQMTSVTDWNNNTTSYAYDPDGDITTISYPNGVTAATSYDHADQVTAIADTGPGNTTLASFAYTRGNDGELTATTSTGVGTNETYTYNKLSQLTAVNTTTYGYDNAGDPTTVRGSTLTYNAADEATSQTSGGTTTTYSCNQRGDRTSAKTGSTTLSYSYDQDNRLTGFTPATGSATSYAYDGDGLRASTTTGTSTTDYAWDITSPVPLILVIGPSSFVYGPDGLPIEKITSTSTTCFQHDQLGSTRLLTDSTGTVTGTYTFGAYGQTATHTGTATTSMGWAGQWQDSETGFYYLRNRYYDPGTAQFITADPLAALTQAPYAYATDDPLNGTDPLGLFGWSDWTSFINNVSMITTALTLIPVVGEVIAPIAAVADVAALVTNSINFVQDLSNPCVSIGQTIETGLSAALSVVGLSGAANELRFAMAASRTWNLIKEGIEYGQVGTEYSVGLWREYFAARGAAEAAGQTNQVLSLFEFGSSLFTTAIPELYGRGRNPHADWAITFGCGSSEVTAGAGISHASYLAPGLAVSVRD